MQKGAKLFTIEDTLIREVECRLRKQELMWVLLAQDLSADNQGPTARAEVIYETAGVQYVWEAELAGYASSGVDPKTRMVPCRVIVNKPHVVTVRSVNGTKKAAANWPLLRDMYVTVHLQVKPDMKLFTVPNKAIHPGRVIWLVRGGKLAKSEIQVVQQLEESTIIFAPRDDISATDDIVTSPLAFPRVDLEVEISTK